MLPFRLQRSPSSASPNNSAPFRFIVPRCPCLLFLCCPAHVSLMCRGHEASQQISTSIIISSLRMTSRNVNSATCAFQVCVEACVEHGHWYIIADSLSYCYNAAFSFESSWGFIPLVSSVPCCCKSFLVRATFTFTVCLGSDARFTAHHMNRAASPMLVRFIK